ncbi:MAG: GNAT family N-acetyltransferase [Anaerolineae bacterium]|nr:GNAT family N-acetyltransferase [Anaerolineae bacterium]
MIRIGDFSRLSQTPVSTLRYYDEVGVFKPVEVDHFTGYRYYTYDQLPRLQRIQALKDMGFSLDEIVRFLDARLSTQQVREMLLCRRTALRELVQDQHERLDQVDAWLKQIDKENNMTATSIRTARIETDLSNIVRITNPYEWQPVTTEQVREWFQYNPPGRVQRRLVSVDEHDAVIGYAGCVHETDAPADRFVVWVIVDPDYRGMKVGSDLWEALLQELRGLGARRLDSDVNDNDVQSLVFAQRRGFAIYEHIFHYALDLTTFDETPFLNDLHALEAQGIRFTSLAAFEDSPETRHKLYDLNISYILEQANMTPPWTFARFEEFVLGAPWFKREGQLLAVDGDQWVGMAPISVFPDEHTAYNLHTGVLPAYRGRNIATSLKVLGARYARENGAQKLITDSNLRNAPIQAINRKMGYKPQPGKYTLVCEL